MSGARPPLRPEPTARGLASLDPAELAELVTTAWGGMIELSGGLDLERPSRRPGRTVRDVLIPLGSWPEHLRFERLVDEVRTRRVPARDDVGARNALVVAAHRDADPADIDAALRRARDAALAFLRSPEAEQLGRELADSPVGALPLSGVIAASAYQLALRALDVAPPDDVPAGLLDAGVGTLVDTTGALAARSGVSTTFAVLTQLGGWVSGSGPECWTTMRLPEGLPAAELGWPSLEGAAADVLDGSAGRRPVLSLVLARRLRLHDVPGLITLLPALEAVPGLPGGAGLRAATRALGRAGHLMGQLGAVVRG
ncbi:MAG TPA: hypothetical protein VI248_11930 [Kineosporiaceae bacterium]